MAEAPSSSVILDALLRGLVAQGQGGNFELAGQNADAFPISGTVNVVALAQAVESALGGGISQEEEAKTPAELNAANDG